MEIQLRASLKGSAKSKWEALMAKAGLHPDTDWEQTVLLWDGDELAAAGSRQGNLLKCIAVDPARRGEDLTATVLTQLRTEAFRQGHSHLFLYTKPQNRLLFQNFFFYPIAQTDNVLLMENRRDGIREFLARLPQPEAGHVIGAAVMNCNPFTLGHRYLIETAAKECDRLYVFVLSEDKSQFSAAQRLEMVRLGTADLSNVTVLPTGAYLISAATFPTYFLKDREQAGSIQCLLDIEIFTKYFVPRLGITHRYVGTEPLSAMTAQYNEALKAQLPLHGITLREIPRLETDAGPISASAVRALLQEGRDIRSLVPESTFHYLTQGGTNHV